jgi:hypothetical protein
MSLAAQTGLPDTSRPSTYTHLTFVQPRVNETDWNFGVHFQDSMFSESQPDLSGRDNLLLSQFDNNRSTLFPDRRKALEKIYSFINKERVLQFIERNHLYEVLNESLGPLRRAFGQRLLQLEVLEDDEGDSALNCLVPWAGNMQEARDALRRFDEQWWFARARATNARLNFDFELV